MPKSPDLHLTLGQSCNLKCEHCEFWRHRPSRTRLKKNEITGILREYAELFPGGTVQVGTSGEPLANPDDTFFVAGYAKSKWLRTHINTNGTLVLDHLSKIIDTIDEITVSIDSDDPKVHDTFRGVEGTWDLAIEAVKTLAPLMKVSVAAIAHRGTYQRLSALHDMVKGLGAVQFSVSLASPAYGALQHNDFFENYRLRGRDVDTFIDELTKIPDCANEDWLHVARAYWETIDRTGERIGTAVCGAIDQMIVVNEEKTMRSCYSTIHQGFTWTRHGDMAAFWSGREARRQGMLGCRMACGASACACKYSQKQGES